MPLTHNGKPGSPDSADQTANSSCAADAVANTNRLAAFMEQKADQATKALGAGMESLGGAIHDHEPKEGILHDTGAALAAKLEGAGRYLETQGVEGVGADLTNLIRQNPIPALLMGVGVGFLLARMLKGS